MVSKKVKIDLEDVNIDNMIELSEDFRNKIINPLKYTNNDSIPIIL